MNFAVASVGGDFKVFKLERGEQKKKTLVNKFPQLSNAIVDIMRHPRDENYVIAGCLDS